MDAINIFVYLSCMQGEKNRGADIMNYLFNMPCNFTNSRYGLEYKLI